MSVKIEPPLRRRWPLPDEPCVIGLLRRVSYALTRNDDKRRKAVIAEVSELLAEWDRDENADALSTRLGLKKRGKGNKAKQATAQDEYVRAITFYWYLAENGGPGKRGAIARATEETMEAFDCQTEKTIKRARDKFGDIAERVVRGMRERRQIP